METQTMASRKSEKLSTQQKKELKEYRKTFGTATECAISLGVSREVLIRVLLAGSGSPVNIQQIKNGLQTYTAKPE